MPTTRRTFLAGSAAAASLLQAQTGGAPAASVPPLSQMLPLRFRQVHLDFHTSEQIEGIGNDFDPEQFAATVEKARVNSITCFARCHHGMIYFDTKTNPERRHPHMKRNLLKEQIEACHKRNIRVPIYTTVQWDYYSSIHNPEWWVLDEKGQPTGTPINEAGFYRNLCVFSGYGKFLKAHVKDLFNDVPVDGLFFDIVQPRDCHCQVCRPAMLKAGVDPRDAEQRGRFAVERINQWKRETTAFVHAINKNVSVFYNAGHIGPRHRAVQSAYTHFELESLPSGGWGYLDFPLKQRYVRTLGIEAMGMTGKFHTSWGDFHSLKNPAALEFETSLMLALNAKCSIGDQLHPSGRIDRATYELIGEAYAKVEKKEPWCVDARPVSDVGVLTPEEFIGGAARTLPAASWGAVRMLTELRVQFDVLDSKSDFSGYRVLVLPDRIPVDEALAAKLQAFVQKGGALLASFESGLDPMGARFMLPSLGVELAGEAPFSPDFLVPRGSFGVDLPGTEFVMYLKGKLVKPRPGAIVEVDARVPYFNRTADHFCSHRHTPSSGKTGYPGIVGNGRNIYFMHPVFEQYHTNAPRWVKSLVAAALRRQLPDPVLRAEGPSTLMATLNEQSNRYIVHLLHYIPERRGQSLDVIEDIIPLHDVAVSVKPSRAVKRVVTAPEGAVLPHTVRDGRVLFTLPKLAGHQMIALEV
jgi:hypothetical protein